MGIPSVGIYAYELYNFYDVKTIIRIGTCGTVHPDVKLLDVVLAKSAYSLNTFPLLFDGDTDKNYPASSLLNDLIVRYLFLLVSIFPYLSYVLVTVLVTLSPS